MKSVGEVMAMGGNFQESMQKAICSMEEDLDGFNSIIDTDSPNAEDELKYQLSFLEPGRIFYVTDELRKGWSKEKIYELTKIDYWFLDQID